MDDEELAAPSPLAQTAERPMTSGASPARDDLRDCETERTVATLPPYAASPGGGSDCAAR